MDREKRGVVGGGIIVAGIILILFVLAVFSSGCTYREYGPIRDISNYNAAIHTDFIDPVLYNSFEQDVLGPIIVDY